MANIKTYTPTPNIVQPGTAPNLTGTMDGLRNLNAPGSDYATNYTLATTNLIAQAIEREIFDTTNEQYAAMYTFMYTKASKEVPSDEFKYMEKVFGRNALTVFAWNGTAIVTLAGTYTSLSDIGVAVNDVLALPNNKKGIVTAVTLGGANASTISMIVYNGATAFAAGDMAAGDTLALESAGWTDSMNTFTHYDRLQTIERYNYIQFFNRARRWSLIEYQKMINNGTTNNFMNMDKENSIEQMKTDMLATFINGTLGEALLPAATAGSYPAKRTNGMYPTMVAAGAPFASVTSSGLVPALETLGFQTNRLSKGSTRMLLGTAEMLHELVKAFKNPIHYAPNDLVANLNLNSYEFGGMKFVPVVVPQMGDSTILPSFYDRMIIGVDINSIQPVHMKGVPKVLIQETKDITTGLTTNMYKDWYIMTQFGMEFNAPAYNFYINVL